jgi:hypothetical protein
MEKTFIESGENDKSTKVPLSEARVNKPLEKA